MSVAIAEQRIVVSSDTGDIRELLIRHAEAGQQHFGVMHVPSSMPDNAFGVLLRSIRFELDRTTAKRLNRSLHLASAPSRLT